MWDLTGGHMEPGETEPAALVRELDEELGVQIGPGSAIHLCRLQVGRGEESVHFSAWIVGKWQGTPELRRRRDNCLRRSHGLVGFQSSARMA
ncbi:NUDIX domain-containing protein [Winogradskya consettensis]|uniref:NUDIX domain-containing protein n=1 Tax=Winogradskya consettensis TaxID=113560 RepID=UPI002458B3AB|nr:NUDIX domain-containing protein [Actinoplanes consettensis]